MSAIDPVTVICGWCKVWLSGPQEPRRISHGICPKCRAEFFPGVKAPPKKCGNPTRTRTVAALFVDSTRGPYDKLPDVEVWDAARDAMRYRGHHPVVAHPSCAPWGRFAWRSGGKDSERDGAKACAPAGVAFVRQYGGVLEHPAGSALWKAAGLPRPGEGFDKFGGWTLQVSQVDWGHKAEKRSWLYIVGVAPGEMPPSPRRRVPTHVVEPDGKHSKGKSLPRLPKSQRHVTPPAFASWLVEIARRSHVQRTSGYEFPTRTNPVDDRIRKAARSGDHWRAIVEAARANTDVPSSVAGPALQDIHDRVMSQVPGIVAAQRISTQVAEQPFKIELLRLVRSCLRPRKDVYLCTCEDDPDLCLFHGSGSDENLWGADLAAQFGGPVNARGLLCIAEAGSVRLPAVYSGPEHD